jgi:hypothetical protein
MDVFRDCWLPVTSDMKVLLVLFSTTVAEGSSFLPRSECTAQEAQDATQGKSVRNSPYSCQVCKSNTVWKQGMNDQILYTRLTLLCST